MASTKISALTDGAPAVSTDIIPAARGAGNVRLTIQNIATAIQALMSQLTVAAGTIVADAANSITQTWNNVAVTFTAFKVNVTDSASAAGSLLADFQIAGVSKVSISKAGVVTAPVGSNGVPSYTLATAGATTGWYSSAANRWVFTAGGGARLELHTLGIHQVNTGLYGWCSGSPAGGTDDTAFARKAAGVVEVNNGTAGTYTGTGLKLGSQTVAQLPAAATVGDGTRAHVSDATLAYVAANIGAAAVGGGGNSAPVIVIGGAWVIGG